MEIFKNELKKQEASSDELDNLDVPVQIGISFGWFKAYEINIYICIPSIFTTDVHEVCSQLINV